MIATVHLSSRDLEAKVRDLTKSLSLKSGAPLKQATRASHPPTATSPELLLTVDRLQQMEEQQQWLNSALTYVVDGDVGLEMVRLRRRALETRQTQLERELEHWKIRMNTESFSHQAPCAQCKILKEHQLSLQNELSTFQTHMKARWQGPCYQCQNVEARVLRLKRELAQKENLIETAAFSQKAPCRRCQSLDAARKEQQDRDKQMKARASQLQMHERLLEREQSRMETERVALERQRQEALDALQEAMGAQRELEACRASLELERRQLEAFGASSSNEDTPRCRFLCFAC